MTVQGGVHSTLMATIYVHVRDMQWTQWYAALGCLTRYADDGARPKPLF